MAKEEDQTQDKTQETQDVETPAVETKEEDTSTAAAVKTSEKFDKIADSEGIEDALPDDEDEKPAEKEADKADAEEKDTGDDKADETEQEPADEKDATGTGESPISKELAQKAIDLGLSEEDVLTFDSDKELQKTVTILEDVHAEAEEDKPADKPAAEAEKKPDAEDAELKLENEDDIDPGLVKIIKGMDKRHRDEVAALHEEVRALKQGVAADQITQFTGRFDDRIDKLGLDWVDTFGKGKTMDMGKRSKAFKNRDAVRGRMEGLAKAMPHMTDEQKLFDLALRSLHETKLETVTGARMHKKTTARSKQRIGRAATKRTGTLTGHQKAVEASKAFDELIDTTED